MSSIKSSRLYKEVTCPFCSLLCDDLSIRNNSGKMTVARHGCPVAVKNFERTEPKVTPSIRGHSVSLDEAINHAALILRNAKQTLFGGSSTDVAGSRELMALAEKSGAIVDHLHGDSMINNILVLQNRGWIMTTLAELKNRADLVIFVGTDASSHYPRFFERFIWNQASLAGLKRNAREIVYLGDELNTRPGINPNGNKPELIKCSKNEINETLAILRALLNKKNIQSDGIPTRKLASLKKLVEGIHGAQYGVIVWDAAEFAAEDGDIIIQTISELIKELNQHSRFSGLSLGGNNGGMTLMNVCAWQSGYPLRVNYASGQPEYDPFTYSTKRILHNDGADALFWLSSFNPSLSLPRTNIPTVILSRPTKRISPETEVYIPVSTPGIDHSGNLFRTDSVVSLPLKKLRDSTVHSGSEILKRIRLAI
ncbi:MAG: formylmethanofuran dehydrogenase subunit B [Planctomycetota bacterium]|jgi:formylmethanofuran dehydrogenase subunit B